MRIRAGGSVLAFVGLLWIPIHGHGAAAPAPVAGAGAVVAATQESSTDPVATFDAAWRIIRDTHYDAGLNGVDWEAVRAQLRPRAVAADGVGALRAVIREMLARLGESHFRLWPGEAAGTVGESRAVARGGAGPGIELGWIDGELVVTRLVPGGGGARAGVAPGWVLVTVDAEPLEPEFEALRKRVGGAELALRARRLAEDRLRGPLGSEVRATFLDGENRPVTVRMEREASRGRTVAFGNLPPMVARLDDRREETAGGATVAVVRFNVWLPQLAAEFDRAVGRHRDTDGFVIDLRGNPGGVGAMVMGIAGHFVDDNVVLGTLTTRESELRYVTNPRRVDAAGRRVVPFAGPLAILVDAGSASTSEVFAGGLQSVGRARVFGERTIGAVLPSLLDRLPNGDVLQHAIADFVVATGERLEGRGVIPDVTVEPDREELLAGRDPVLEEALEWIEQERRR